jgi:hypothetical protein
VSELLETLRLHQPLPAWAPQPAATAKAQPPVTMTVEAYREQHRALHYSQMAAQALSDKLRQYQQPMPMKVPGAALAVERLTVDGIEWTCCVNVDNGEAGVWYVLIGTAWAHADDVVREDVMERLHDAAQAAHDQQGQFARETLQERVQ